MALRTMSVDIDFGVDLSEINKLDSSVDDVVQSVTGGMSKAEKSINGLGSEFKDLGGDAAKSASKIGGSMGGIGSDATSTAKDVNKISKALDDVGSSGSGISDTAKKIGNLGKEAKDAESKVSGLADKLSSGLNKGLAVGGTALAGLATGFLATAETSQDFIEDMGKLDTAFTTSGHSAEVGKKTYQELVGVLGETDQAVEAANHLAKLTDNEKDLQAWTEICTGVYATFGDSLPIEGLTEAANETAKVGQVVGPLADALNWAGVSEDEFNKKLEACNSEQERAQLITSTLNGLYDESSDKYKEINGDLIESRQAQSNFSAAMAEVGKIAMPIVTKLKNAVANFVTENKPMLEEFGTKIGEILEDVGGKVEKVIAYVSENLGTILPILATVVGTIIALKIAISAYNLVMGTYKVIMGIAAAVQWAYNTALFGCPVIWIIAAIMAIIAVIVLMVVYWDEIVVAVKKAWEWIVNILSQVGEWIYTNVIQPVVQFFVDLWNSIIAGLQSAWQWIVNLLITVATWIWSNVISPILTFYVNFWTAVINGVVSAWNWIVGLLSTVASWVNENVIQPLVNFFTGLWEKVTVIFGQVASWFSEKFQAAYDGITNIFSKIGEFFSGVWETIKTIFTDIGQSIADGVSGAFKSTVNAVLGFADSIINGFIGSVNSAIDIINEIPLVEIPLIPEINIPRLATGGVVDGSTVANVGEAGAEAIVPLENNLGWLNKMGGMIANAILSQAQYQPSSHGKSSGSQSITVQEGAVQITISGSGNSGETAYKVKETIEAFFANLRKNGSYAVTEV